MLTSLDNTDIMTDPELFAGAFLRVLDKQKQLVPLNWNPIQRELYGKLSGKDLILKARQVGISTMVQGDIFRRLITQFGTRALTLTHSDTTTQIFREMADRFYKYLPDSLEVDGRLVSKPVRQYANASQSSYPEFDSSHFIGTAGNKQIGRGGSYSDIHLSEVAFFPDAESILAGALQGGDPRVILESTANGAQGFFYNLCMDALAGRGEWKLHFYAWFTNPEYTLAGEPIIQSEEEKQLGLTDGQIRWRRKKQDELKRLFPQEYPETVVQAFLTSGRGFFADIQDDFYQAPKDALPVAGHKYTGGLDFGQSGDYTVMPIVDRTARAQVDLLRINKMSWGLQRAEIGKMYRKWHLAGLRAEKNSIGSVNIEELEKDGLEVESFETTNSSKQLIFQRFHEELEQGFQLLNDPVQRSEMNTMTSKQTATGKWAISADGDAHDDCPVGLALAITAKIGKSNNQVKYY